MKKVLLVWLFLFVYCVQSAKIHEIVVQLSPETDPIDFGNEHGLEHIDEIPHLDNYHAYKKSENYKREIHPHVANSSSVLWWQRQIPRKLHKRTWNEESFTHSDPLYDAQWHLTDEIYGLNVMSAWKQGFTGKGVTVALVDDGLEKSHDDIADNYSDEGSIDINDGTLQNPSPPTPRKGDDHGTSAAGCAGARDNQACGVGTAFRATLTGIRLISRSTTDSEEAKGIAYMPQKNDIYSNSWGPNDDGKRLEGPGPLATAVIEKAMVEGRGGLGSIYVWAAGNGRSSGDNCNYDGWANSRYTISIPAVDIKGNQAYYSESCSANIVTAPSSGSSKSITTSDLTGALGGSHSECRSNFGGTSAAAPMAAGVIALVLEANKNLSWRDVQHVLIRTARPLSVTDSSWAVNGAGYNVSHKFGFGLLDAGAATSYASDLDASTPLYKLKPHVLQSNFTSVVDLSIPDNDKEGVSDTIIVSPEPKSNMILEHVEAYVWVKHAHRGELRIILESTMGTKSYLMEPRSDSHADINGWRMMTVFCWGEPSAGVWKLTISDERNGSVGTFNKWQLRLWGYNPKDPHPGKD